MILKSSFSALFCASLLPRSSDTHRYRSYLLGLHHVCIYIVAFGLVAEHYLWYLPQADGVLSVARRRCFAFYLKLWLVLPLIHFSFCSPGYSTISDWSHISSLSCDGAAGLLVGQNHIRLLVQGANAFYHSHSWIFTHIPRLKRGQAEGYVDSMIGWVLRTRRGPLASDAA